MAAVSLSALLLDPLAAEGLAEDEYTYTIKTLWSSLQRHGYAILTLPPDSALGQARKIFCVLPLQLYYKCFKNLQTYCPNVRSWS